MFFLSSAKMQPLLVAHTKRKNKSLDTVFFDHLNMVRADPEYLQGLYEIKSSRRRAY